MSDLRVNHEAFAELSADLLGRGSVIRFRAHGRSMSPLIRDGDVLTVEPATIENLRVGEVALHRIGDGQLVAHRVVGRDVKDGHPVLRTRGDAVAGAADEVREQDVLGRVVERERHGRVVRLNRGLWRVLGRLAVTLLPLRARLTRVARAATGRGRPPSPPDARS